MKKIFLLFFLLTSPLYGQQLDEETETELPVSMNGLLAILDTEPSAQLNPEMAAQAYVKRIRTQNPSLMPEVIRVLKERVDKEDVGLADVAALYATEDADAQNTVRELFFDNDDNEDDDRIHILNAIPALADNTMIPFFTEYIQKHGNNPEVDNEVTKIITLLNYLKTPEALQLLMYIFQNENFPYHLRNKAFTFLKDSNEPSILALLPEFFDDPGYQEVLKNIEEQNKLKQEFFSSNTNVNTSSFDGYSDLRGDFDRNRYLSLKDLNMLSDEKDKALFKEFLFSRELYEMGPFVSLQMELTLYEHHIRTEEEHRKRRERYLNEGGRLRPEFPPPVDNPEARKKWAQKWNR